MKKGEQLAEGREGWSRFTDRKKSETLFPRLFFFPSLFFS